MNKFDLSTIILIAGFGFFLYRYGGWRRENVLSGVLGVAWGYFFFQYGSGFMASYFPSVDAGDFFVLVFLATYVGSGFLATLPFLEHGDIVKARRVFVLMLGTGFGFTALDNALFGPNAVGPTSPYVSYGTLIGLPVNLFAEDVTIGKWLEIYGRINPFTAEAVFWCYTVGSMLMLLIATVLVAHAYGSTLRQGLKRLEKMVYAR